jgi:hypothetical protein
MRAKLSVRPVAYGILAVPITRTIVGTRPAVVVTRTNNKKITGQLVRDLLVNRPGKKVARVCYGLITLATKDGNVDSQYRSQL